MKLVNKNNRIDELELKDFTFAPSEIFWLRKPPRAPVKLLRCGDVIDHEYLKKFEGQQTYLQVEFPPKSEILESIRENLDVLLTSKTPRDRTLAQEKLTYNFSLSLWAGTHDLGVLELMELFHRELGTVAQKEQCLMKGISHELFTATTFKATMSCVLAISLGMGHGRFLQDLYGAHFLFFSFSKETFSKEYRDTLTGERFEKKILNHSLNVSSRESLKKAKVLEFPLVFMSIKRVVRRLVEDEQLDIPWTNYSDLEEIIFASQKSFHSSNGRLDVIKKYQQGDRLSFCKGSLNGFLQEVVTEFQTKYKSTNPRFIHLLKKRMEEAFDPDSPREERPQMSKNKGKGEDEEKPKIDLSGEISDELSKMIGA